jgi:polyisoprenoid-binding protein YceI
MTRSGVISFHSHTILEDIDAENKQVMAAIDGSKKSVAFSCMMKQFVFPRKLMQQHFNESYVESDKFPKATFSGTYTEDVNWQKDGIYPVNVRGRLSIHGVTREVQVPAQLEIINGKVTGTSTFKLNPSDYEISIPFIVRDKIEKENTVKVKIEWTLSKEP